MALLAEAGAPAYRADQLLHGLYRDRVRRVEDLSTFPRALRGALDARLSVGRLAPAASQASPDGTLKLLLELSDRRRVEAVAIPAGERLTACLSTQVGCALGCRFCATAQMGFLRNLRAGEMLAQFLALEEAVGGRRITNVVFMGMGEPLANLAETLRAIRFLNAPWGVGLRRRGIRVSTVGLAPQIERLAREEPEVGLTISLSAPRDELRDRLVPVNRVYPLRRLMQAAERFAAITGRMVSFAYILIPGVNDSMREGRELVALLSGRPCKLNLIPLNPHPVLPVMEETAGASRGERAGPAPRGRHPLVEFLQARLPHVTYRVSRGVAIQAACGQLYWGREDRSPGEPRRGEATGGGGEGTR